MTIRTAAELVLDVEGLHLTYDSKGRTIHALQDAGLQVRDGEAVGVAGESGCGKSTLARAVLGLLPAGAAHVRNGRIVVAGTEVTRFTGAEWQRVRGNPVAIVFQDPLSFLNPVMRIEGQISEAVRCHDPGAATKIRCAELLDLVRLRTTVLRQYPHELSGGMRQRVMLAIALACRPRLLIADEPTTALDAMTQAEILALLRDLRRRLAMAFLFISHDLGLLRWNCDRVYIMYAGHTVESGATEDVLMRPAHPYTRGLIEASRLDRLQDGYFATIGGDVPQLDARSSLCPFLARCGSTLPHCREAMPPVLAADSRGHAARCWLLDSAASDAT